MKKVLLCLIVCIMVACISTRMKYGRGGENACQYAKEYMGINSEDIKDVAVTDVDSVLTDAYIGFYFNDLYRAADDYDNNSISKEEYDSIVGKVVNDINDISNSWLFGSVVNDSLRHVKSKDGLWRKIYTITVKMKSGDVRRCRVLMDSDGTTPRMTDNEMQETLRRTQRDLSRFY